MPTLKINRLALLGVGLIGGSLARALKQHQAVGQIVGYGRHAESLQKAMDLGVIDAFHSDVTEVVAGADVIVIATPLGSYAELLSAIKPALSSQAVITDVGSVKGSVVDIAKQVLDDVSRLVPGHPIAGTENSGVEASFAELFAAHRVILTPLHETDVHALGLVTQMWQTTGAEVVTMDVQRHDQILAATSHLPHMLAYALVDCLASMDESDEIFSNAAGGFADFTRIASSNPQMWHDICYSNRASLLNVLDKFDQHIDQIRKAISHNDSDQLLAIFQRAKQQRDRFMDQRRMRQSDD